MWMLRREWLFVLRCFNFALHLSNVSASLICLVQKFCFRGWVMMTVKACSLATSFIYLYLLSYPMLIKLHQYYSHRHRDATHNRLNYGRVYR